MCYGVVTNAAVAYAFMLVSECVISFFFYFLFFIFMSCFQSFNLSTHRYNVRGALIVENLPVRINVFGFIYLFGVCVCECVCVCVCSSAYQSIA